MDYVVLVAITLRQHARRDTQRSTYESVDGASGFSTLSLCLQSSSTEADNADSSQGNHWHIFTWERKMYPTLTATEQLLPFLLPSLRMTNGYSCMQSSGENSLLPVSEASLEVSRLSTLPSQQHLLEGIIIAFAMLGSMTTMVPLGGVYLS